MVIFVFLRTAAGTVIPSVAVPLSLVGTFGVMYLAGLQHQQPHADGAHHRHRLRRGRRDRDDREHLALHRGGRRAPPLEAALKGSEQIGFTIISLTFSLIAVLIPLLFMGDVVGRLFREFAVTLAVAILISAVVSLTLTPMMCARLLRHTPGGRAGPLLPRQPALVRPGNRAATAHARLGARPPDARRCRVAVATLVADRRALHLSCPRASSRCRTPASSRAFPRRRSRCPSPRWRSASRRSRRVVLEDPAVDSLSSFIGVDGTNTTLNSGRMLINLKPHSQRAGSATEVDAPPAGEARASVEGITLYMQPVQDLTIEDRVSRTQYQFTLEDAEPERACRMDAAAGRAPSHAAAARRRRRATCRTRACRRSSRSTATPPARLGITPAAIDNALYNAFGQRLVSTIFTQTEPVPRGAGSEARVPQGPERLTISTSARMRRSAGAARCRCDTVTRDRRAAPPRSSINHIGQFPVATISFNLAPALRWARRSRDRAAEQELGMPASMRTQLPGGGAARSAPRWTTSRC